MSQVQVEFSKKDIEIIRSSLRLYYEATYVVGEYEDSQITRNQIFAVATKLSKVVGEDITDDL